MPPQQPAELGATVELDGTLEGTLTEALAPNALIRCEQVRSLSPTRPWSPEVTWRKSQCVLKLDDGKTVMLDLSALEPTALLPYERVRQPWPLAKLKLLLIQPEITKPPVDDILIEVIVSEAKRNQRVRIRGVITDTRHASGSSEGAFRTVDAQEITALRVTHIAGGADPAAVLQAALGGVTEKLPSVFDQRLRMSRLFLLLGLLSAAPLLVVRSPANVVYFLSVILQWFGLAAGVYSRDRGTLTLRTLSERIEKPANRGMLHGPTILAITMSLTVLGSILVVWIVDLLRARAASPVLYSNAKIVIGMTIFSSVGFLGIAITDMVRVFLRSQIFLRANTELSKIDRVISGIVVDSSPVEGPYGKAAAVLITDEEVVPGSDPNIQSARAKHIEGFSIKLTDSNMSKTPTVHVNIDQLLWCTTVSASETVGTAVSGHSLQQHVELIPLGAQVRAFGSIVDRATTGPTLRNTTGKVPLFVCAPHEEPVSLLYLLRAESAKGVVLGVLTLVASIVLAYWLGPSLPNPPPGD